MKHKGTTKSRGNKHVLDKFYTKNEIVEQCLSLIHLDSYDCIIEPSAGNGAFSNRIKGVLAFDISPENDEIQQADWLTMDKKQFSSFSKILVIGNPPFGTGGKLAYAFLSESMKFSHTVAFILPKGFKKSSMKNRIPMNFHLVTEKDLPTNSFILEGINYSVPCVFQIWERSEVLREKVVLRQTTDLFRFVKKADADFRIQRVGGNAGKASLKLDASSTSNYFIKNTSKYPTEFLIQTINGLTFPSVEDTTGPRSLPKGEIIACLEKSLNVGE